MNDYVTFRITRNKPYDSPTCPGYLDTAAREGYYEEMPTDDVIAAAVQFALTWDFAQDPTETFTIQNMTYRSSGAKMSPHERDKPWTVLS